MAKQTALIIGAGPAGLTAAYELLDRTDIHPIVFEASGEIGGISRTARYRGNRMDIGGHRFFSKSDRVMDWWLNILPMQGAPAIDDRLLGREVELATTVTRRKLGAPTAETLPAPDPEQCDDTMLVRSRLSRILFLRKFFDYPVSLSRATITNLGAVRMLKIVAGILYAQCRPIKPVVSLEDFFINRFGRELYQTFFQDYTEKVWGVSCKELPAEWGAQRVKGLSLWKTVLHALKSATGHKSMAQQKEVETSLIESFIYPKFGPGQLWETVAAQVRDAGGEVRLGTRVVGVLTEGRRVTGVEVEDVATGARTTVAGEYLLSSMPLRDLIAAFADPVPADVRRVGAGLPYRDFMTVGVLAKKLLLPNNTSRKTLNNLVPDNWIYVQEPDVRVGRLQLFNNWSPYLVADLNTAWVGMEYFCTEGDAMWRTPDAAFTTFAVGELAKIGVVDPADVLDTTVIRVQKAYPAYFGTYNELPVVRAFTDQFANLFLMGRNGMHRYNNMDHSMLTAMAAVENIISGDSDKSALWSVNAEDDYHEEQKKSA